MIGYGSLFFKISSDCTYRCNQTAYRHFFQKEIQKRLVKSYRLLRKSLHHSFAFRFLSLQSEESIFLDNRKQVIALFNYEVIER